MSCFEQYTPLYSIKMAAAATAPAMKDSCALLALLAVFVVVLGVALLDELCWADSNCALGSVGVVVWLGTVWPPAEPSDVLSSAGRPPYPPIEPLPYMPDCITIASSSDMASVGTSNSIRVAKSSSSLRLLAISAGSAQRHKATMMKLFFILQVTTQRAVRNAASYKRQAFASEVSSVV